MSELRREHESHHNPHCTSLFELLLLIHESPDDPALPAHDFGRRLDLSAPDEPAVVSADTMLGPLMTWSWPLAFTQGVVPLSLVLCDELRLVLGMAPVELKEAVEEYWNGECFVVALEAAKGDAEILADVSRRLEKKKEDLRAAHAILLAEAEGYREYDQNIDGCLSEICRKLDVHDYQEVLFWIEELELHLQHQRALRDPQRLALKEYLTQAGEQPCEDASLDDMRHLIEQVKAQREYNRLHIIELEKVALDPSLPSSIRECWSRLAANIDRPSYWVSEGTAIDLAWAVGQFTRFLQGQVKDRDSAPETADLFMELFCEWLPAMFQTDPTFSGGAGALALDRIKQLAQDIYAHRSERHILEQLGVPDSPLRNSSVAHERGATMAGSSTQARGKAALSTRSPDTAQTRQGTVTSAHFVSALRIYLRDRMIRESPCNDADPTKLRSAIRGFRWKEVRELAAALAQRSETDEGHVPIQDYEAVYAVALASSTETSDPLEKFAAMQNACLATLSTDSAQYYYYFPLSLQREHELPAKTLILATGVDLLDQASSATLVEKAAQALEQLVDMPATEPAFERVRDLFWKASRIEPNGSERLANHLWEGLRGKDSDEARSHLLRLLFRLRRRDALKHLARHVEQIDDLVRICLSAFEQAEDDTSVRPQAREILITLREQGARKRNISPWIKLFQNIESVRGEAAEAPVQCTLQSDVLAREAEKDSASVQILLTPSLMAAVQNNFSI